MIGQAPHGACRFQKSSVNSLLSTGYPLIAFFLALISDTSTKPLTLITVPLLLHHVDGRLDVPSMGDLVYHNDCLGSFPDESLGHTYGEGAAVS